MSKIITTGNGGGIIPPDADAFTLAMTEAKPTLDHLHQLRDPFAWYDQNRNQLGGITLHQLDTRIVACAKNRDVARYLYDLIPDQNEVLDPAQDYFEIAECVPTTEANLHRVIGRMLNQMPNTKGVSDDYRLGLSDSIMYDPEIAEGYRPGFSMPVYVQVVREIRRTCEFAPSQARFIELCQKHRIIFRDRQRDLLQLHSFRDRAEAILMNLGEVKYDFPDDEEGW
jgi:hypothetical protein